MTGIKYYYKAANKHGQIIEGVIEASEQKAVAAELRAKSLYLLNLSEISSRTSMDIQIGSGRIGKRVLAVFCSQLASILKAGVPLVQALTLITEQTDDKKFKGILAAVCDELQRGTGLAKSFAMHEQALPTIMIQMIEAGELSGTLDKSLERLALAFEKDYQIAKKVKSAMTYPVVVGVVALLVIIFMLAFVIPRFVGMFESMNIELPGITKLVLGLSDLFVNKWMYLLGGVLLVVIAFKLYKSSEQGRLSLDRLKLKLPVFKKAVVRLMAARLSRTIATLTATGITLTQTLRVSSKVVLNKLAENRLLEAEEQIKQGRSLHEALAAAKIFPGMLIHLTKIGEESGTLDHMLENAADYFEEEADVAITRLTTLLQPLMLVIMAVVVLGIILAVLVPMLNMYSNIM